MKNFKFQISNFKFPLGTGPLCRRGHVASGRSDLRGFTFIEVLIVISMIAMLAALIMPKMKGTFQTARLKDGARTLAGLLRFARNTAVLRERPCEIRFDLDKNQYRLVLLNADFEEEDMTRRQERNARKELSIGDDVSGVRTLPRDVHFSVIYSGAPLTEKGQPRVIYYADGSATPATIVLEGKKKSAINIEVYQTTGIAHVETGQPTKTLDKAKLYYGPKADKAEASS